jgi:agmatine deiminase
MISIRYFPAEWEEQDAILLAFPHEKSDWASHLEEAIRTWREIAHAIAMHESCLIVCDSPQKVKQYLGDQANFYYVSAPTNDTWCRDFGAITIMENGRPLSLDFCFNGWGKKFDSTLDNQVTHQLNTRGILHGYESHLDFILEGGSIDSNGDGIVLVTSNCLLHPNRNPHCSKKHIESYLKCTLGIHTVLWLNHGYLEGDDTDSHIDMLARFIDSNTILYLKCTSPKDPHFKSLQRMEQELQSFTKSDGSSFRLIPLPFPDPIIKKKVRFPASYANFLFINGAVLVPIYGVKQDSQVLSLFQELFPMRCIVPIDCSLLISQGGSLHCSTMQFPKGSLCLSNTSAMENSRIRVT